MDCYFLAGGTRFAFNEGMKFLVLLVVIISSAAFADITTPAQLIAAYQAAHSASVDDNQMVWFFQQKPTLDEIVTFASFDPSKFKVRNYAFQVGAVKTPGDFIKLYSNIGEINLTESTVDWLIGLKPTIAEAVALASLEKDPFRVRTKFYNTGAIRSIPDLVQLYSGVAPVYLSPSLLKKHLTPDTSIQDVLSLVKIGSNRPEILRGLYRSGMMTLTELETAAPLSPALQTFRQKVPVQGVELPTSNSPSVEEIETKIYAVHSTNFYPLDNTIHVVYPKNRPEIGIFRPTTHFALGELVRSHSQGAYSWEGKKFAIITPLKDIMPQMISLNTYDSFILGDFKLTSDSVLVYQTQLAAEVRPGITAVAFDPAKKTLRQAIDEVIKSKGGYQIRMREEGAQVAEALMDGRNINSLEFFSPLIRKYPHASFGAHMGSVYGQGYDYGYLDMFLTELATNGGYGLQVGAIKPFILAMQEFILYDLQQRVETSSFAPSIKKTFKDHAQLAEAAIGEYQKSIPLTQKDGTNVMQKALRISAFSPSKLKQFILLYPEQFEDLDLNLFISYYYIFHISWVGKTVALQDGSWNSLSWAFSILSGQDKGVLLVLLDSIIQREVTGRSIFANDFKELLAFLKRY